MSNRNAGVRGCRHRGRHPRDDLECHPRVDEGERFFSASPENKRVTTLQPYYSEPGFGPPDKQAIYRLLVAPVVRLFADVDLLGGRRGPGKQALGRQAVVNDDVRLSQQLCPSQCEQTGVSRAGADQVDGPSVRPWPVRRCPLRRRPLRP